METAVGVTLARPTVGSTLTRSAWHDNASNTYFAAMGPTAVSSYVRDSDGLWFGIHEREVFDVYHPAIYVHPSFVDASVVNIKGSKGVLWSVPGGMNFMSYVEWFTPGRKLLVVFPCGTPRETMLEIAEAIA
jgi:hypothetical protein